MSFRFFKRFQIAPGLTVNLSKSGLSLSVGPRGAKVTLGPKGVRTTVGIPGTGVSYTKHHAYGKSAPAPSRTPRDAAEEGLLSACHALDQQQAEVALDRLRQAGTLPDACWMAGFLLLEGKRPDEALAAFEVAHARAEVLGQSFDALGVEIAMELPGTPQLSLSLAPGPQSAALGLVMRDNTTLSLGPGSRLVVERFLFEPEKGALAQVLKLSRGSMAAVSGEIVKLNPAVAKIDTPVYSVGIRGTHLLLNVEPGFETPEEAAQTVIPAKSTAEGAQ